MQSSQILLCCFLAITLALGISHEAPSKMRHEVPAFAPGVSSVAPATGRPEMHGALNFKPGSLRGGSQQPQLNPQNAVWTRPALLNLLTMAMQGEIAASGEDGEIAASGEVTASSILAAWTASNSVALQSSVYQKALRKVDDVFNSWVGYESPGERLGALRAMERLKGKEEMVLANQHDWRELDEWNFKRHLAENKQRLTDENIEVMEQIIATELDDEHPGPEHHIFGLAYGDSASENVMAVAKAEITMGRDDNAMLTKAARKQYALSSITTVHIVDTTKKIIDAYVQVVYITDLVAKPTPTQKKSEAALLEAIVDWARISEKIVVIYPDNQETLDFYKQLGFELIDPEHHNRMVFNGDREGNVFWASNHLHVVAAKEASPAAFRIPPEWGGIRVKESLEDSQGPAKQALLVDFVG